MQDATSSTDPIPPCPRCAAGPVVRNGPNPSGTPTFRCRGCGRRFVARPKAGPVPDATRALVRRLLGERLSLRAIARTAQVSRTWLPGFVNAVYRDEGRWAVEPPAGRRRKNPATS
ncbi:MAG: IS1/IS1595 family N-terminal zinc-binding domain-containing protein [Pseudonocardia sp.]